MRGLPVPRRDNQAFCCVWWHGASGKGALPVRVRGAASPRRHEVGRVLYCVRLAERGMRVSYRRVWQPGAGQFLMK